MVDALHTIVHEVDLTLAIKFAFDRLTHQLVAIGEDIGLDRQTIFRWRIYHAQITNSSHGHVERPWNGRCGECQYVNLSTKLLEALLMAHTKALLLINNDKSKVTEVHILGEEAVGTDENIDLPTCESSDDRFLLCGRTKA